MTPNSGKHSRNMKHQPCQYCKKPADITDKYKDQNGRLWIRYQCISHFEFNRHKANSGKPK